MTSRLQTAGGLLLALMLSAAALAQVPPPKPIVKKASTKKTAPENAATEKTADEKPVWRTYEFQVVSKQDQPVAGATINPWQVAYGQGSMWPGEDLVKPLTTDANGKFQFVIPKDAPFVPTVEAYGIRSLAFQVDHPDFPLWSDYVPVEGDRKIHVADPATITIKLKPATGNATPRDLFPVPTTSDWSEKDGVVTIRRVDLVSNNGFRWLRIVQAPKDGPASFTDLINIREHEGPTISIEAQLKPGVRVAGHLAANSPRPITSGRALATIVAGGRANGRGWWWNAATDINPDGTFEFASLPEGDTVQIITLCDGWVSASPTKKEVEDYGNANNFATGPQDDKEMRAGGRVYPRLHRLVGPQCDVEIPMEATLTCMVTVLDENDVPIPDADVSFWPNQYAFDGGSQMLGAGGNSIDTLSEKPKPPRMPTKADWPRNNYAKKTDAGGIALVTGLPFALGPAATLTRQYRFTVSHADYKLPADAVRQVLPTPTLDAKIEPGQIGQITVRMQPK